jgi:hypothetical protein
MTCIITIGVVLLAVGIFMEMAEYQKFSRAFDKHQAQCLAQQEADLRLLRATPPPLPTSTS